MLQVNIDALTYLTFFQSSAGDQKAGTRCDPQRQFDRFLPSLAEQCSVRGYESVCNQFQQGRSGGAAAVTTEFLSHAARVTATIIMLTLSTSVAADALLLVHYIRLNDYTKCAA